jgi:hypothetical protein
LLRTGRYTINRSAITVNATPPKSHLFEIGLKVKAAPTPR